jgi:hypothetical protein
MCASSGTTPFLPIAKTGSFVGILPPSLASMLMEEIGPSLVVKGGVLSYLVGSKTVQQKYSFVARDRFRTMKDLDIAEAIGNISGNLKWGANLEGVAKGTGINTEAVVEEMGSQLTDKYDDGDLRNGIGDPDEGGACRDGYEAKSPIDGGTGVDPQHDLEDDQKEMGSPPKRMRVEMLSAKMKLEKWLGLGRGITKREGRWNISLTRILPEVVGKRILQRDHQSRVYQADRRQ